MGRSWPHPKKFGGWPPEDQPPQQQLPNYLNHTVIRRVAHRYSFRGLRTLILFQREFCGLRLKYERIGQNWQENFQKCMQKTRKFSGLIGIMLKLAGSLKLFVFAF